MSDDRTLHLPPYYVGEVPAAFSVYAEEAGVTVDPTGSNPVFRFQINDGVVVQRVAAVTDGPNGEITYEWQDGDLSEAGMLEGLVRYSPGGDDRVVAVIRGLIRPAPVPVR